MYKIEEVTNKILQGDALQVLKTLPDESINCCMSSPPYWSLRDYQIKEDVIWDAKEGCEHEFLEKERFIHRGSTDVENSIHGAIHNENLKVEWKTKDGFCQKCGAWKGQLGLEPTFDLYISHLADIFDEVKRVLRKDGTCFVNLGDTYWGGGNNRGSSEENLSEKQFSNRGARGQNQREWDKSFKSKSLCNIPARFSIEMQNRGWILRNVVIWHKPNCMPSSVKDRFTVDFEYLFFFVKNKNYWFETQYEPIAEVSLKDKRKDKGRFEYEGKRAGQDTKIQNAMCGISSFGRNKRAVWTINSKYENCEQESDVRQGMNKERGLGMIEKRDLLPQKEFVDKLRANFTIQNLLDAKIGLPETHIAHWFRYDENGFAYPSKEDWELVVSHTGTELFPELLKVYYETDDINKNRDLGRIKRAVWSICPKPFKESHFACVSQDTECLTIDGWKRYNEIDDVEILTFNLSKKLLEYKPLLEKYVYDYDGFLIKCGNRDLNILMTPNHRNVVLTKSKKGYIEQIKTADKLTENDKIRISADFKDFNSNNLTKEEYSLLGWFLSEGYIDKYSCSIYQNEGIKSDEIRDLLIKCNIQFYERTRNRAKNKEIIFQIKQSSSFLFRNYIYEKDKYKKIPKRELLFGEKEKLIALFESLIKGDGNKRKEDGRIQFIQKNKIVMDFFQELCILLGKRCVVSKRKEKDIYSAFVTNNTWMGLRNTNGKGKNIKKEYYKGIIWCPRTENQTFVARRNGRVFITGNTYPQELCETPLKAGCPIGGIVLDPFFGAGTTGLVALKQNKRFIGIELNPEYIKIAEARLKPYLEQEKLL